MRPLYAWTTLAPAGNGSRNALRRSEPSASGELFHTNEVLMVVMATE